LTNFQLFTIIGVLLIDNWGDFTVKQRKTLGTRYEILQCATKLFLEKGYTGAYVTTIAKTLQISTGNLTFWFPTKEHILAELVRELCAFQVKVEESGAQQEGDFLKAYLFELVMFASVCEENPNIKDLVVSAYTHPLSLGVIRANDTKRAKCLKRSHGDGLSK